LTPTVGIIANPASARDIRRVVANATGLQIADRANIVLRVLAALASCGIKDVLMMPETGGICAHILRGTERSRNQGEKRYPRVTFLDMPVTGTVADTKLAARLMRSADVACIVVLGGDGTHRAVASECDRVPIAGISTGTNNAFPDHREPTITGLAAGLAVIEHIPERVAFSANKRLDVVVNGQRPEHALVDVALVTDGYVGARALWRTHTFRELYVTFADPQVIGMAGIAGLIEPVSRREMGGLMMRLAPAANAKHVVRAPIAPGLIDLIGIDEWRRMPPDTPFAPRLKEGAIALDGEREIFFSRRDQVSVKLVENAFRTVDVAGVMQYAAHHAMLRSKQSHLAEATI
jgi:predicted polyphosphate/ATP-dependent NAD kinase